MNAGYQKNNPETPEWFLGELESLIEVLENFYECRTTGTIDIKRGLVSESILEIPQRLFDSSCINTQKFNKMRNEFYSALQTSKYDANFVFHILWTFYSEGWLNEDQDLAYKAKNILTKCLTTSSNESTHFFKQMIAQQYNKTFGVPEIQALEAETKARVVTLNYDDITQLAEDFCIQGLFNQDIYKLFLDEFSHNPHTAIITFFLNPLLEGDLISDKENTYRVCCSLEDYFRIAKDKRSLERVENYMYSLENR